MTGAHAPPRIEARLKVTGHARFEGEIQVPGMVHAALVISPLPSARVRSIDASEARLAKGFAAIITHETAPRLHPVPYRMPLQDSVVHFAGQPVAIVLAETAGQ